MGRLIALLLGSLAALVIAELFLRVYDPLGRRLWGDLVVLPRNERQVIRNTKNPRLPETIFYSRNSLGLRGPEPPASFASALTVVVVGGSTTESRYQADDSTWPARVGQALAPHFKDLWLANAGLDGHSAYGHLRLLEQHLVGLRPDMVVFLVGINDVGREGPKRVDGEVRDEGEGGLVTRLARRSALAATLQNLARSRDARMARLFTFGDLDLRRLPHLTYSGRRPEKTLREHRERYLPGYRDRLSALLAACRRAKIVPVLITQPALYGPVVDDRTGIDLGTVVVNDEQKVNGALAWDILELYNEVTRDVGAAQGVEVIELGRVLPKSSRLFYDFVHFTDAGAQAAAAIVSPPLCRVLARELPQSQLVGCPAAEPVGSP